MSQGIIYFEMPNLQRKVFKLYFMHVIIIVTLI